MYDPFIAPTLLSSHRFFVLIESHSTLRRFLFSFFHPFLLFCLVIFPLVVVNKNIRIFPSRRNKIRLILILMKICAYLWNNNSFFLCFVIKWKRFTSQKSEFYIFKILLCLSSSQDYILEKKILKDLTLIGDIQLKRDEISFGKLILLKYMKKNEKWLRLIYMIIEICIREKQELFFYLL